MTDDSLTIALQILLVLVLSTIYKRFHTTQSKASLVSQFHEGHAYIVHSQLYSTQNTDNAHTAIFCRTRYR